MSNLTFTRDQDRIITILAERGFKAPEIAERLGRSRVAISVRARRIGVKLRPWGSRGWSGFLTSEIR